MGKYFSIAELTKSETANKRKIDNKPTKEVENCLNQLIDNILDPLRKAYAQPIIVSSRYRCPELNKAVGGARTSQHTLGQAADIHTKSNSKESNKQLFELIKQLKLPFDQLINEYNYSWVHVSYSNRNRRQILNIK